LRRARRANRAAQVERQLAKGCWSRWQPAWKIKTGGSSYRISFDVHRAFGLWTWALLFTIAFTGFSLNLNREVFAPAMALVSKVTPSIWVMRNPRPIDEPISPKLDYPEILQIAEAEGLKQNIKAPVGALWYNTRWGIYGAQYFEPGDDHGAAGVGPTYFTFDGQDGRFLWAQIPWEGTAADIFKQAQFPLHSGRILGMPGRILISFMGLVAAALAITGVAIWYRKRRARVRSQLARQSEGTGEEILV
jgi:uncharacterized iron-regulated membrane protein